MTINNFLFLFFFCLINLFSTLEGAEIAKLIPQVVATYPHNAADFTQGLICEGNIVYESCGLYGESKLKKYELETGKLLKEIAVSNELFAEGIAFSKDQLIQLTWREQKALVYDKETFELKKTYLYLNQGWGLCADNDSLWMSNGSSQLIQRDPNTFAIQKIISVKANNKAQGSLNDLISVGSHLYANVFGTDVILQINKKNGEVTGMIDASSLLSKAQKAKLKPGATLNGIAYRTEKDTFLITGKYWPLLFEVRFIPKT